MTERTRRQAEQRFAAEMAAYEARPKCELIMMKGKKMEKAERASMRGKGNYLFE
jgi:hypothetical protein